MKGETMQKMKRTRNVLLAVMLPLLLVVGACATGSIRERILTLPVIEGATYVGDKECAQCHEEKMGQFAKSEHGKLADFEVMGGTKGCESCHGPASLHIAGGGDKSKILSYKELVADEASAVCLKCHTGEKHMEWAGAEHALNDVACNDCHKIHQDKGLTKASLKKNEPELCYTCHKEQQAQASFPSHHPVKEGKMTCSSCHEPHGSAMKNLKTEERVADLCFNCHSRYQGPFVYEHAPVQEDCTICHNPHGTVANNLLKQNEPFLCLQCHEAHFHITREGSTISPVTAAISGTNPDGTVNPLVGTSSPQTGDAVIMENANGSEGWRMAFGTKCTVCHTQIHGSDLPSQTAPSENATGTKGWPSGAKALTR
jgi:DmsE family decaheme c-type cytochrome